MLVHLYGGLSTSLTGPPTAKSGPHDLSHRLGYEWGTTSAHGCCRRGPNQSTTAALERPHHPGHSPSAAALNQSLHSLFKAPEGPAPASSPSCQALPSLHPTGPTTAQRPYISGACRPPLLPGSAEQDLGLVGPARPAVPMLSPRSGAVS
ncbi:hypothetical protein NDU88_007627 [Pleurodeles waltl]|uniref:Uncharacterized protein n=1 Tax=Pleurodeles waltl TaxID=8319 RepID=A0AAV7PM78_PLEWA|nr:hypothetical protein NDU88_007627 [Pleurodeles waltl]